MIIESPFSYLTAIITGYFVGAIPFGLILTGLAGLGDIRDIGSGNIGATNVLRTGKRFLAGATLVLDAGKGWIAVFLFSFLDPLVSLAAGGAVVIGHNFPIWLKFRGGKGVATTIGVLFAVAWPVGAAVCLTWLLIAIIFRLSSLAAILSLSISPIFAWWLADMHIFALSTLLGTLSLCRHHENIARLIKGEETTIGENNK